MNRNKSMPTYQRPQSVTYTREDLQDLMGPVKTQYCDSCAVSLDDIEFLQAKPDQEVMVTVDTGGCPNFQQVTIEIPGESPMVFPRTDGAEGGSTWSIDISGLQFILAPGDYTVDVTLMDGSGLSTTCSTLIRVIL